MRHCASTSSEKRGDGSRSSALWGKGGRGFAAILAVAVLAGGGLSATASAAGSAGAYVPAGLRADAAASPSASFRVIVEGRSSASAVKTALGARGKIRKTL